MEKFTPIHQFEIRYSSILNFPKAIGEVLAPFVKLASRLNIDQENSHNEKVTLFFDEEQYIITAAWDRIIFKKENLTQDLSENNSILESPFLDIFSKLKEEKSFGEITNYLFYSFNVKVVDKQINEVKDDFINQRLHNLFISKIPNVSDVGVSLEFEEKNGRVILNSGPYLGLEDIQKRSFNLIYPIPEGLVGKTGELAEFRYHESGKKFTFAMYKEIKKIQDSYLNKLWVY